MLEELADLASDAEGACGLVPLLQIAVRLQGVNEILVRGLVDVLDVAAPSRPVWARLGGGAAVAH
eukprot:2978710-Alexandrium_andersonii.AAC.1